MDRIYNDPNYMVEDMLKGFVKAHKDLIEPTENARVLKYKNAPVENKVGIVTGGGSGHKPAFIGYIGKNLCDAVAVGEIFSSPTAAAFLDAFKAADSGRGVACLYGNYAGDNMNVKMAIRKAKAAGITVKTVVANDDCASAPKDEISKRRGVAGEVLMWKVGGAKAAMGADLDEVIAAAQKAIDNTRSVGIGTAPCTIAAVGHPNFTIEDGTMEVGIGHHGEMCIRDSLMAYHFVHRVDTLRIDRHGLTQRLILQHLAAFLIEGILNITGNIDLIYTQFYSLSDLFIRVSGTSVQYQGNIYSRLDFFQSVQFQFRCSVLGI